MHLIADHLGWLEKSEQGWTIEGLLKSRGEQVVRLSETGAADGAAGGGMEAAAGLSPEDVAGWSKVGAVEIARENPQRVHAGGQGCLHSYMHAKRPEHRQHFTSLFSNTDRCRS